MITATRPSGPRGELDRSVSLNVPASAGLRSGSGQARRSKRIFDPADGAYVAHLRICLTRHVCAMPDQAVVRGPSAAGKRARASLRTGVRPVGNGLVLRCLLGARAPPGSNPPPSRVLRSSPLPCCAWHKRTNWSSP